MNRLLSEAEFRQEVDRHLYAYVGYFTRITVSVDGTVIAAYGEGGPEGQKPSETRQLFEEGEAAVSCEVELWRTTDAIRRTPIDEIANELGALVRAHWGGRDAATLLPSLKVAATLKQFVNLMRERASVGEPVAVLHTDLDSFGQVNKTFGEKAGDEVLREFADRMRAAFGDLGVAVRTGGEEFSAILYGASLAEIVRATDDLRRSMQDEPLAAIKRPNTCSIGLCLYSNADRFADVSNHDDILEDARSAEMRAKAEGKNRIVLFGPAPDPEPARNYSADDLIRAALAARRILGSEAPEPEDDFATVIVNRLIQEMTDASSVEDAIQSVKTRFGLLIGDYTAPSDRPAVMAGLVDSLTWATWSARAVLSTIYQGGLTLDPNTMLTLSSNDAGALSLSIGDMVVDLDARAPIGGANRVCIGRPFYPAEIAGDRIGRLPKVPVSEAEMDPMSPVLLLPIGDEARALADGQRQIVGAMVEIDDRPSRGGGLPDFWQSNVSRVIRACLSNPNITTIIAVGDKNWATNTLEWLGALADPARAGELQTRLTLTPDRISALQARNLKVRETSADRSEMLAEIATVVEQLTPLDFVSRAEFNLASERSARRLAIPAADDSRRLSVTDGLLTRTLADAYPEAIQLIRRTERQFDFAEASRGSFREFSGFKIVLSEPLNEMVPDYWRSDRNALEDYYERTFKSADGLFGRRILSPLKEGSTPSLYEFAVEETADAIRASLPTRRINLPLSPDELTNPLGLSTIQILPRCREDEQRLDILFVWRTVDALVGFPFSGYGSICWARDFVQNVNDCLEQRGDKVTVTLGTLTYIALSFHMYLHNGDQEIARTIVQDASR